MCIRDRLGSGSGVPTPHRNQPAIHIRYCGDRFLWDCGEGAQRQMLKAGLSIPKLDRVFITHWHADHWAGLVGLLETLNLEGRERPLEIYGPEATRFVNGLANLSPRGFGYQIIAVDVDHTLEQVVYEAKDYKIISIPVEHGLPAVGYCFLEKPKWNVDMERVRELGLEAGPWLERLKEEFEVIKRVIPILGYRFLTDIEITLTRTSNINYPTENIFIGYLAIV